MGGGHNDVQTSFLAKVRNVGEKSVVGYKVGRVGGGGGLLVLKPKRTALNGSIHHRPTTRLSSPTGRTLTTTGNLLRGDHLNIVVRHRVRGRGCRGSTLAAGKR